MALNLPTEDVFENQYTNKFSYLASPFGVFIEYKKDRAAIDLGLHLTALNQVTNTRVWFQLKGIHESTLAADKVSKIEWIDYDLKIDHLRAWYMAPEAVYLVVYVESVDAFFAEDIKDIVNRQWGDEILNPSMFREGQVEARVKISKSAQIDESFWKKLYIHRSMRIDGPSFRGRPLGHTHDPLASTLRQMEPELFTEMVNDLLAEHGYRPKDELDANQLFPDGARSGNLASLTCGVLYQKYEIVLQITNEIMPDEDGFRIEGDSDYAHGPCAVLIHSLVKTSPNPADLHDLAEELVKHRGIKRLLVFVNASIYSHKNRIVVTKKDGSFYNRRSGSGDLGTYLHTLSKTDLKCRPQHLEDISFSLLTTTNTYHRFRDKVSWFGGKLWAQEEGPFFILPGDGGPPIPFKG